MDLLMPQLRDGPLSGPEAREQRVISSAVGSPGEAGQQVSVFSQSGLVFGKESAGPWACWGLENQLAEAIRQGVHGPL